MNILLENAQEQDYKGFKQYNFFYKGNVATIVLPKVPNSEKKWIWRAEFLGAFDTVDVEMLNKGWYLAYYSINDMYGCPEAIDLMQDFYGFLVSQLNFYKKSIIFGFSRGGLYAVNFALKNPDSVSVLYLDAPVLDIKSWPAGMWAGEKDEKSFSECLKIYNLDISTVKSFKSNPIDRLKELLDTNIPIALVAGDSDKTVPHTENAQILFDFYKDNGREVLYILKHGCGHHPHSLVDPTPVAEFLIKKS